MLSDAEFNEASLPSKHSDNEPFNANLDSPFTVAWHQRVRSDDFHTVVPKSNEFPELTNLLRPWRRATSTGSGQRLHTQHSSTSSFCTNSPPPSRSSSLVSGEMTTIDIDHINALYTKREEIRTALEHLSTDLLKLLQEEWNLTGVVPLDYERTDCRLGRTSQRLKSTSYPMRQLMVTRANTFSHPQISRRSPQKSTKLNPRPDDRLPNLCKQPSNSLPCTTEEKTNDWLDDKTNFPHSESNFQPDPLMTHSSPSKSKQGEPNRLEPVLPNGTSSPTTELTTLHHSGNQISPNGSDELDDTRAVEQAMVQLKIRRLEVDYAVVSHLRNIHKQKAMETKRDAYRLAYKTNSRKLKEIMAEMTLLKAQLNCENDPSQQSIAEVQKRHLRGYHSRKSLKFFPNKKHSSLASLPNHGSDVQVSDRKFSVSTPTTPGKPQNAADIIWQPLSGILPSSDNAPVARVVPVNQGTKPPQRPRRTSLLPPLRIFHTQRQSIKVSASSVPKLSKSASIKSREVGRTTDVRLRHSQTTTDHSASPHGSDSSISWKTADHITHSFSMKKQTFSNTMGHELNPAVCTRLPPVPNRFQQDSTSTTLLTQPGNASYLRAAREAQSIQRHPSLPLNNTPSSQCESWKSDLDPEVLHGGSEIKQYIDRPFAEPGHQVNNQTNIPCFGALPKQTSTTSSNISSSNWSTSGCSSMMSNTSALSPESGRNIALLRRATSAPAFEIRRCSSHTGFDRDSSLKLVVLRKRHTCPTEHVPRRETERRVPLKFFPHYDLTHAAHRSRVDFESHRKTIVPIGSPRHLDEDDDEGYIPCSDSEGKIDDTAAGRAQCDVTLVECDPEPGIARESGNAGRVKRSSIRPLMMLRRAFSRMSSRGSDRSIFTSTKSSPLKTPVAPRKQLSQHR